jgi:DNA recombination protein RmuC
MTFAIALVAVAVAVAVVLGIGIGAAVVLAGRRRGEDAATDAAATSAATAEALIAEVRRVTEEQRIAAIGDRDAAIHAALHQLVTTNQGVMEQAKLAGASELDGKKSLIDAQLASMTGELGKVTELMKELEQDRISKFSQLSSQLQTQSESMAALTSTTQSLRQALSSTKARGQWGERMAEDVLRLAGFVENINYRKQRSLEGGTGIPDYTFMLPQDLCLYMDVKFPLDNYLRMLETEHDLDQKRFREEFLRDVRKRVKELAARDYAGQGNATVDCVLLFIPNEQLYAFIQEHDGGVLDEALRNKVVFCSPLTLFAVLAVVRQSVDNFRLERTSGEILELLGKFSKQWEMFSTQMDKVGTRIEALDKEFDVLKTTRTKQLERQLDKIDDLRQDRLGAVASTEALGLTGTEAGPREPARLETPRLVLEG